MSIYVQALMPFDFDKLSDKAAAIETISNIKDQLATHFCLKEGFKLDIEDNEGTEWSDMPNRYTIDLPFYEFEITIGNGFVIIDTSWNYSQYFYISDNHTLLRDKFFDFITALGYKEAFIVDEYHGWNKGYGDMHLDMSDYAFSFEYWKKEFPVVPKIEFSCFYDRANLDEYPEHEDLYLDDFKECFERKKMLEERFSDYKILTIGHVCGEYILALKDGSPVLLNEKTGKPLRCGKIDGINARFNGAGFAIIKGNKCAFYSPEGKRLTPYRVQQFAWKWPEKGLGGPIIYTTNTQE